MSEHEPCVIALCNCGCERVVYANGFNPIPKKDIAEIGRMVADGYTVLKTTVGEARAREWGCAKRRQAREAAKQPSNV